MRPWRRAGVRARMRYMHHARTAARRNGLQASRRHDGMHLFPAGDPTMVDVKHIAPVRIGGTDIAYAQGVRAGNWLFFTGHMATDFENGLDASVVGKPGLPLAAPRHRREGDYIIA